MRTELYAASLRADNTDTRAFLEALAVKLEGSLPDNTTVTRQSGLFSREHPVKEVAVSLGDYHYRIGRERQGPLVAVRGKKGGRLGPRTGKKTGDKGVVEVCEALGPSA